MSRALLRSLWGKSSPCACSSHGHAVESATGLTELPLIASPCVPPGVTSNCPAEAGSPVVACHTLALPLEGQPDAVSRNRDSNLSFTMLEAHASALSSTPVLTMPAGARTGPMAGDTPVSTSVASGTLAVGGLSSSTPQQEADCVMAPSASDSMQTMVAADRPPPAPDLPVPPVVVSPRAGSQATCVLNPWPAAVLVRIHQPAPPSAVTGPDLPPATHARPCMLAGVCVCVCHPCFHPT